MGPPGSGKGTLSELCVQHFGWQQLSTGNLCRDHIQRGTRIGQQIQETIALGGLVSDEIIADMVVEWILSKEAMSQGIVFDGYPRTKKQAAMLYTFLQNKLQQFELILVKLNIDAQILVDRIVHRVVCANKECGRVYSLSGTSEMRPKQETACDVCHSQLIRRSDDTYDSLQHRLKIYYQHEQEIVNFYVDKGLKVGMLQGAQAIQEMFEEFKKIALHDYVC